MVGYWPHLNSNNSRLHGNVDFIIAACSLYSWHTV